MVKELLRFSGMVAAVWLACVATAGYAKADEMPESVRLQVVKTGGMLSYATFSCGFKLNADGEVMRAAYDSIERRETDPDTSLEMIELEKSIGIDGVCALIKIESRGMAH